MKLIDNWKSCYKFWSIWTSSIGAFLMLVFSFWPDSVLFLWNMAPTEVKELLPNQVVSVLAVFIFAMTVFSRILKQDDDNEKTKPRKIDSQ